LLDLLEGTLEGTLEGDVDVVVSTRLVVRGSTGAPYVGAADGVVDGTRRMAQCQRR
jgi:cytoskeletal protein CcmA (bactofilin family)